MESNFTQNSPLFLDQNKDTTNKLTPSSFIKSWKAEFISKIKKSSKSRAGKFDFDKAKSYTSLISDPLDKLLIRYVDFIQTNPLRKNDYVKYVNAYSQGRSLDKSYFRHDLKKLEAYYKKIDDQKKKENKLNLFSTENWETYVLFLMLKLEGLYSEEFDSIFNVKHIDNREYNPATKIPSVLRAELPYKVKEFDIHQANPTFVCKEIGIEPIKDIYSKIGKKELLSLLNTHKGIIGADLGETRKKLGRIFGGRNSAKILTEYRFKNKGQMFRDLAKYEEEYIKRFVRLNDCKNYVRLHDAVIVKEEIQCDFLELEPVVFKCTPLTRPEIINNKINWYDDQLKTSPSRYADFLIQEGFKRISQKGNDEITVIKSKNKTYIPFNHKTDTTSFLAKRINETKEIADKLRNILIKDTKDIQEAFKLITPEPLELHRDTKTASYFPFKNGVAKVTADDVEMVSYESNEIGLFHEFEVTQKHIFKYDSKAGTNSDFRNFLFSAILGKQINPDYQLTESENKKIKAFQSMIGYLLSTHKDDSNAFAIILSDEGANDETRRGRRGKGLLQKALEKMRICSIKPGPSFDPLYRHRYGDIDEKVQLIILNDVEKNFRYNSLYTDITENMWIEPKGRLGKSISFEEAPKFIISTNWIVQKYEEDSSTNARFKEYKFTDFWNSNNRPNLFYKHNFFNDWDISQWNDFFCFMIDCVSIFIKNGLSEVSYEKTSDNFFAKFNNAGKIEEFERIFNLMDKENGFTATDFIREHQNELRGKPIFHFNNLKKHLEIYAEYHGLKLTVDSSRIWKLEKDPLDEFEGLDDLPF